ncbi:hypothetical protein M406DRAFT_340394 [Cryphonectria parasitica EP155]|uniref:Uncharacterized protein n=1 Tax=Cryphonectria parasitica (strain ATCC 38755 / EP155) TaxID=660469 RepID=A0A9P4Y0S1_CRYP1|nr:uncharacterized protein M406DRAFT_340394 [Cryphonectria parasitica EP155]KAF3764874.1 hypothetical protein M406DRAFT_340394 [Cryphonectria parasitica EP155]
MDRFYDIAVATMPHQSHLFHGCWLEAERADRVAMGLDGLRAALDRSFHGHMIALTEEIRGSSQLLRELASQSGTHKSRAPIVSNHLNVLLPCMSKTLRDITTHYDDKTISREMRWRKMYHDMMKEVRGIPLPQRFILYNQFLRLLHSLLIRDKHFDQGQLEMLRHKILELRELRGIPDPVQTPTTAAAAAAATSDQLVGRQVHDTAIVIPLPHERVHWCEQVFVLPLSSRTDIPGPEKSRVFQPVLPAWDPSRPKARKTLMRRSFDSDRMCVKFLLDMEDIPYIEIRVYSGGAQYFTWKGHDQVRIQRDGNSLVLKRWSRSMSAWKSWAVLSFVTWEELVLFYCTFTALKCRNPLAPTMGQPEFSLKGETLQFQAQIVDDDYRHSLCVYKEERSGGIRLQAAVWNGELRKCPVWTAFVTHISASPRWLVRISDHIFHVRDIQLYVFCQKYRESRMRRNRLGAFEIYFLSKHAADEFGQLFNPSIAGPGHAFEVEDDGIAGPSYT